MNTEDLLPPHSSQLTPKGLKKAIRGEPDVLHGFSAPFLPDAKIQKANLLTEIGTSTSTSTSTSTDKHLHKAPTVDKHALLSEVRKQHGPNHHLLPQHVHPKSFQDLKTQVRTTEHNKTLHKTPTIDKHALMAEVRKDHCGSHLHSSKHVVNTAVLEEVLSERAGEDPIKIVPAVAEESIQYGKKHLKKGAETINKQAVLSEVRTTDQAKKLHHVSTIKANKDIMTDIRKKHGNVDELHFAQTVDKHLILAQVRKEHGAGHLKPTRRKSTSALMTDIRTKHGNVETMHFSPTVEKQAVLSQVRKEHGGRRHSFPRHIQPKATAELMRDIRDQHGNREKLHWTQTVEKQSLLSDVRKEHGEKKHLLKHTSPKSTAELMREVRAEHGKVEKLHWTTPTVEKQSILTAIRASHGHATS